MDDIELTIGQKEIASLAHDLIKRIMDKDNYEPISSIEEGIGWFEEEFYHQYGYNPDMVMDSMDEFRKTICGRLEYLADQLPIDVKRRERERAEREQEEREAPQREAERQAERARWLAELQAALATKLELKKAKAEAKKKLKKATK